MAKNTIDEVVVDAIQQMIKIGNALNWNPPIDQDFVDVINSLRALRDDIDKKLAEGVDQAPRPQHRETGNMGECENA